MGVWTNLRVAQVRKMAEDDGLSASRIAAEIGFGVTRNAVIGIAHRQNIALGGERGRPSMVKERPRSSPVVERRAPLRVFTPQVAIKPKPSTVWVGAVATSLKVTIADLALDGCRWPIGDPLKDDFVFCGSAGLPGRPYCAGHCAIAYQPPAARR